MVPILSAIHLDVGTCYSCMLVCNVCFSLLLLLVKHIKLYDCIFFLFIHSNCVLEVLESRKYFACVIIVIAELHVSATNI